MGAQGLVLRIVRLTAQRTFFITHESSAIMAKPAQMLVLWHLFSIHIFAQTMNNAQEVSIAVASDGMVSSAREQSYSSGAQHTSEKAINLVRFREGDQMLAVSKQ